MTAKRTTWTPDMDATLRRLYPRHSAAECAAQMGVGAGAIYTRAGLLGLHKSPAWQAERARQRWAEGRHETSRASCFKGGAAPFNKGRPQAEWMAPDARAKCAQTQFRPGQMRGAAAKNWVPIGTEKVRDGQLVRKLTDDPGIYPAGRWTPVSRLVWEAAHGPVPAGHVVRFRDGMATTHRDSITLDRLELVTRAENMRRNSRHTRYPPDLNVVLQLKGALTRKINNRSKAP